MTKFKLHINPSHILIALLGALISGIIAYQDYSDTSFWITYTLFKLFIGSIVALILFQIIYPYYLKYKK